MILDSENFDKAGIDKKLHQKGKQRGAYYEVAYCAKGM